jgi:hypothetical protein
MLQRDESITVFKMCMLLKKCYLGLHILFPSLEPILRCGIHNFPQIGTCLLCVWVGSKNLIWEKWVHVAYMSTILTFVKEQISVCVTHAALHTSWTDAWFCRCYRFQSLEIFQIAIMVLRSGFNFCPFKPWPDAWTDVLLLGTIKANRASDSLLHYMELWML